MKRPNAELVFVLVFATWTAGAVAACMPDTQPSTDQQVQARQDQSLAQAAQQVGMPAITHWQEMRMAHDLYELRDTTVPTHAYVFNEQRGCMVYLGPAIGYGLPYATQYTSPTKWTVLKSPTGGYSWEQVPQAEPNGLFMPSSAEGTWIQLKDPNSDKVSPVYVEPRVVVSPFRMQQLECPPVEQRNEGKR